MTNDAEFHSPQREAAIFYGMFLRGRSEDELREEIDVSPKLLNKWMRARDFDPDFRENLRRIYVYRKAGAGKSLTPSSPAKKSPEAGRSNSRRSLALTTRGKHPRQTQILHNAEKLFRCYIGG